MQTARLPTTSTHWMINKALVMVCQHWKLLGIDNEAVVMVCQRWKLLGTDLHKSLKPTECTCWILMALRRTVGHAIFWKQELVAINDEQAGELAFFPQTFTLVALYWPPLGSKLTSSDGSTGLKWSTLQPWQDILSIHSWFLEKYAHLTWPTRENGSETNSSRVNCPNIRKKLPV